jgi:hypothetical protein
MKLDLLPAKKSVNRSSLLLPLFLVGSLLSSGAYAQASLEPVIGALKAGNAGTLATYFEANIELTVGNQEGTYSKAQAEQVVRNFFASHTVSSFVKKHESSSGGNSQFAVGDMVTSNGTYRVDIFYKIISGQLRIQRLKFTES